ncbi:MAG: N-acetylmuramic acid 6-phosphate etherase [Bauldia sp.]|nr:N-acetylmuramic acid 6-phosphate etherase [Bauldia sp.]
MDSPETISPRYVGLDTWSDASILDALAEGQERAVAAARTAGPALIAAAEAIVGRLGGPGRLVYVGAGSSGILAALDGMELAGTFGWPEERVVFVLANGAAIVPFTGEPEDDPENGRRAIGAVDLTPDDVVVAVAASGATPFTVAAAEVAAARGALTIGIAGTADAPLLAAVDHPILLDSGPEVIVGSTRMGAGTAQKAALNMLSTLVMIRLGRVIDGLMVDARIDNAKLRQRAIRMLVYLSGGDEAEAGAALDRSDGRVKIAALVMRGFSPEEAEAKLAVAGGNLRTALASLA